MDRREIENKLYDLDYENENIRILDLIYLLVNYKNEILYTIVVTFSIGILIAFTRPTYYEAKTIMINQSTNLSNLNVLTNTDVIKNQNLIKTFEVIAKDKDLIKKVMENIGMKEDALKELKNLDVKVALETQMLEITYKSPNPIESTEFLNSLTYELSNRVSTLLPSQVLKKISPIKTPEKEMPKRRALIIAISIAFGFILGVLIATLHMILENKILTIRIFKKNSNLDILTTFQVVSDEEKSKNYMTENIKKSLALLKLKVGLEIKSIGIAGEKKGKHLLLLSTVEGEGKSFFANNLAIYLGELGYKILVLKTELEWQKNENLFKGNTKIHCLDENEEDLYFDELKLEGESKEMLKKFVKKIVLEENINVDCMYMDQISYLYKNANKNLEILMNKSKTYYDLIIVESPALSVSMEHFTLRKNYVDSVIYVAGYRMISEKELSFYTDLVLSQDVKILGMVINKVPKIAYKYQDYNNGEIK